MTEINIRSIQVGETVYLNWNSSKRYLNCEMSAFTTPLKLEAVFRDDLDHPKCIELDYSADHQEFFEGITYYKQGEK